MTVNLRVLLLEDSDVDAELLVIALRQAGFAPFCQRVQDRESYLAALHDEPDIILADYSLPQFTAIDALHLLADSDQDIPTIVVSGVMSEEACVEALRHGAVDYLLKDRLTRLGPAVHHALGQRALLRERHRAELTARHHLQRFHAAFDNAPIGMAVTTPDGQLTETNTALTQMTGRLVPDLRCLSLFDIVAAEDRPAMVEYLEQLLKDGAEASHLEVRLRHSRGHVAWAHYSASVIADPNDDQRHVVHQFLDITARRRAEQTLQRQAEQLARSNAELQELDRLKSQFVATVSHELRTPLSSICGYTELLVQGDVGDLSPSEHRIVGIIERNSQRLLSMIEDLLTFSRVDAGTLTLNPVPSQLNDIVAHVCTELEPMATKNGVSIHIDADPGLRPVRADAAHIERALVNLLSNAVKFSPDGGTATVSTRTDPDWISVSVADTGIGIAAEEQDQLFQRFYRSATAQGRQIPGSGLGLAITKAIIEAHHGTIALSSSPGAGTTVTFRLPHSGRR